MRNFLLSSCCLIFSLFASSQRNIDVQHYRFEIALTDESNSISCKATLTVKFAIATDQLVFDLTSSKAEKGMLVSSITEKDNPVPFTHQQDKITVTLSSVKKAGELVELVVSYKGVPTDGLIISKNKYGHRTFFADNWPNRGHNWLPCVDDPADKASVEFIVTAPQHYQVVSNGILVEETNIGIDKKLTHWKEDVPLGTKVMVIGVADFAVNLAGVVDNCIPVYSWVYPEDRDKGFYDYALAAEILPYFIKTVGPYGYKKLANVQSKTTFGGLENANTIFYAESSITGKRTTETLLSHEIAHQWFGNMATEKSFAHLWLSEGFATYMTVLYMENKYGADTALSMLSEDRKQVIDFAKTSERSVVDEDKDYMQLLNANSYQKGSWILHMLRRQLGDSVFYKSIRSYYATYTGVNADTKDLQQIFEKTAKKDLSQFFQQWLYTPGIPRLNISWSYLPNDKKISLTVTQLQKNPFVFPLDLQLDKSNAVKTVNISKQEETFFIPVKEKPGKLVPDPNVALLFTGMVAEKK